MSDLAVSVATFKFVGNTLLPAERLETAVKGFLNRPLIFTDLQAAAAAAAELYRQEGWVVRAYLPEQDLAGGVVTIQIIEAIFGGVHIQPSDPKESLRVNSNRIQGTTLRAQALGQPISTGDIDRALLLIDDLPGITAQGSLTVGRVDREADLLLNVANEPFLSGDARVDNTGSHSTGEQRLTGNVYIASPTGQGDLIGVNLLRSEGTDYGRLAYRLPLGHDGWMGGVSFSDMRYQVVSSDFASLQARGASTTSGLELSYPLLRSRQANLALNLAADRKRFNNESSSAITTRYDIDSLSVSLSGNRSDVLGGEGTTMALLSATQGDLDLSGSPNAASDAKTTRTAGQFTKLRYALGRQQLITDQLFLLVNLTGQLASKNLDSAEKFYLGGASGVRAYPSSEGGGSEGHMLNLELHIRFPQNFSLIGFYDWGHVRINRDNDFTGAPALNSFSLQGAGLSLGWASPNGVTLRATWAHRIGNNPNATTAGRDQDGTLVKNRFWLMASLAF